MRLFLDLGTSRLGIILNASVLNASVFYFILLVNSKTFIKSKRTRMALPKHTGRRIG